MLHPFNSDARLVRQTLSGHQDSFSILVERYEQLVFASAYGIVANASDAEDVTQDAFLAAFKKLTSLREPAKFRSWILTIARNRSVDVITERKRETPIDEADLPATDASETIVDAELRVLLRDRIERLPTEHREILLLHYYAGLKVREIAGQLDISTEAAKKRLQRARDLLTQRMLAQLHDTIEEQSPSSARTKTIIGIIAGTSVTWKTSTAVTSGIAAKISFLPSRIVTPVTAAVGLGVAGFITLMVLSIVRSETTNHGGPQPKPSIEVSVMADTNSAQTTPEAVASAKEKSQDLAQAELDDSHRDGAQSATDARTEIATLSLEHEESQGLIESPWEHVRVSGFVVNKEGIPVPDARITVVATGHTGLEIEPEAFRAFRDPRHHYVARSNARGEYSISSIGYAGNARINVWANGYANVNSQFSVEPGGDPIALDITLPKKGLLLKARILDNVGTPVPDAFVVAPTWNADRGVSRSVSRFFGRTDETGLVQLGFAMLGGSFGTKGLAHVLVSSPTTGAASFERVPIGGKGVVDLRMQPSATMRGRIEPSEELGLTPHKVILSEVIDIDGFRDFGYTSTYMAFVNEDGDFRLGNIPPNRAFTLWVQTANSGDILAREKLKAFSPGEMRSLNRSAGNGVVIQGTVYGAETGRPVPNVRVGHGFDAWQIVDGERAWSNDDGRFTLVVSKDNESVNIFSAHAFIRESELQKLASQYGNRFKLNQSKYDGVKLLIPDPVNLRIRVADVADQPIGRAAVIVNGTQLDYTDGSGKCTLALHSAYIDSIEVRKHDYIHSRKEDYRYESKTPTEVDLHVLLHPAAGGLEGWFTHSDGTPIVNAVVHAQGIHDSGTVYTLDGETNAEGRFILLDWCPAGDYDRIEISLEHLEARGRKVLENVELEAGAVFVLDPIVGQ